MKILLIGRTGQVGWELLRTLAPLGEVIAPTRETLDLAKPDTITRTVRTAKPDIIVNAAAYTAVDRAEREPDVAFAVNAIGAGVIAEECKLAGALLIHYSTDYVFDGKKCAPYTEEDEPNPLNVYGKSKLEGERAIRASGSRHIILRTSWVYGARGQNFLLAIVQRAREKKELRVVDDQFGAPTWCRSVAEGTAAALAASRDASSLALGTFHLSAEGRTSWLGFARKIMHGLGLTASILPVTTAQYGALARRPANSLLDHSKLARVCGVRMPEWEERWRFASTK